MKKNFFLLACVVVTLTGKAQYTLTASSNPTVGDVYNFDYADTTGINGGASGMGVLWNYTNLSMMFAYSHTYTNVAATTNGTSFPTANIAELDGTNTLYYNYSTTKVDYLGSSNSGYTAVNSDPETFYTLPFSYGSSSSDNSASSYTISGIPYSMTGTTTATGEGTGTLNLPNGMSYSNVLKMKIVRKLDIVIPGTSFLAENTLTSYLWLSSADKFPLLVVSTNSTKEGTTITSSKGVSVNRIVHLDVNTQMNTGNDFAVFPIPAKKDIYLNFRVTENEPYKVSIYNTLGKSIKNIELNHLKIGLCNEHVDLSELNTGIYFIKLSGKNTESIRKIIIE